MKLYGALEDVRKHMGILAVHTKDTAIPEAQKWLVNAKDPLSANQDTIRTYFIGWDGAGNPNHALASINIVSMKEFVQKMVNNTELTTKLFGTTPETKEKPEQSETKLRLTKFLRSLEARYPEIDKTSIEAVYTAIRKGNISDAKSKIKTICGAKFKEQKWNFDSDEGLGDALRDIKDTAGATEAYAHNKDLKDAKVEENAPLVKVLDEKNVEAKADSAEIRKDAKIKTDAILKAMEGDPDYVSQLAVRKELEEFTRLSLAKVSLIDAFIKDNKDTPLPSSLKAYNDMRGLTGFWNVSDEQAAMNREIAVMAVGFIVTMGASTALELGV